MFFSPGKNHSRQPKPADHGHGRGTARRVGGSPPPLNPLAGRACPLPYLPTPDLILGEVAKSRRARVDPTSFLRSRKREGDGGAAAQAATELSAIGAVSRRQLGLPPPPMPRSTPARRSPRPDSAGAGSPVVTSRDSSASQPTLQFHSYTELQSNSNATTAPTLGRSLVRSWRLSPALPR